MMKAEKIDCMQTNNLSRAHLLWKAGLKTKSLINFNLAPDLLNTFIREVIQKAMDNKGAMYAAAQNALLRLEGSLVHSVVYEQYAVADSFDPDLCRVMLDDVAQLFNYPFDLAAVIRKAEQEHEVDYARTLKSISPHNSNIRGPVVDYQFEIFLEDLFILMEATKTPMNRAIIQTLPNLTFTKRT